MGRLFPTRWLFKPLHFGHGVSENPESEQSGLYDSQLDRCPGRASPFQHQDSDCQKSKAIPDRALWDQRNAYDLITGYRADDSYFDFAEAFLNNAITVEQLSRAMRLGKLGEQIVLKSQFAFSKIKYEGFEVAEKDRFYVLRKARNDEANQTYQDIQEEEVDGLYMQDILRGGITNDDPRIPRNVSK